MVSSRLTGIARPFRPILLLGTLLPLLAVPLKADKDPLSVEPQHPRQGDAVFVRLRLPAAEKPQATWRGRSYPLFQVGEEWVAVLPIKPDSPAGAQSLTVRYTQSGAVRELKRRVPVASVAFPTEHLSMKPAKSNLYNYPGVEREERPISAAIRTRSGEQLWSGDWSIPVKGRMATPFGVRRLRNGKAVGRHRGTDIAAKTGVPIHAPAGGRVMLAETGAKFRKYGGTVILDHGLGVTSMYIHMSAVEVHPGQVLRQGEELGKVGAMGVATGPHLHWSVYVQGDSVSPLFFVNLSKRGVGR